jgi:hypothetical protein
LKRIGGEGVGGKKKIIASDLSLSQLSSDGEKKKRIGNPFHLPALDWLEEN